MKVLVIGRRGQLASALADVAAGFAALDMTRCGRDDLDLRDAKSVERAIARHRPDAIVNTAAWTAVDDAEDEPTAAASLNVDGPRHLAEAARENGCRLIHISTDYVYDGTKSGAYVETDATNPSGVYGRTKLAGERAVHEHLPDAIILRTAWVYSPFGNNFVRTMLRLGETRDALGVVADQVGSPTSALDLARTILAILSRVDNGDLEWQGGVYHAAGGGEASWADLARETFRLAEDHPAFGTEVNGLTTADWPTKAIRPANSVLDCSKLDAAYGVRLPQWRDGLAETIARLTSKNGS